MSPHAAASRPALPALAERARLSEEALELLAEDDGLEAFANRLAERGQLAAAARLLAHALPTREAIWWAWMCARSASGESPTPETVAALAAVERWVHQPGEDHRREAMVAGRAVGFGTPAGCAAAAAFLSGGSIAPADLPDVLPDESAAARAIAGGVIVSAFADAPDAGPGKLGDFIAQGIGIARELKLG